jgi:hypothetical protein
MSIDVTSGLDAEQWDEFTESSAGANIFHTREFFDIFEDSDRHAPRTYFLLEDGAVQAMVGAVETSVVGPARLRRWSSRSVVYGGILCRDDLSDRYLERHLGTLMAAYDDDLRRRALYSEIRNLGDATELLLPLAAQGHQYAPHLNYLIDLSQGEAAAFGRMSRALRRALRRMRDTDVEVLEATSEYDVEVFHRLVAETYARVHVPFFDVGVFRAAWRLLAPLGRLRIILARDHGEYVAARGALVYKGRVFDWFAGTSSEGYQTNVNALLVWSMLEWGCRQGLAVFDFGGAGDPREQYSVRDFKHRFRGTLVNYGRFRKVYSPTRYALGYGAYRLFGRLLF